MSKLIKFLYSAAGASSSIILYIVRARFIRHKSQILRMEIISRPRTAGTAPVWTVTIVIKSRNQKAIASFVCAKPSECFLCPTAAQ